MAAVLLKKEANIPPLCRDNITYSYVVVTCRRGTSVVRNLRFLTLPLSINNRIILYYLRTVAYVILLVIPH